MKKLVVGLFVMLMSINSFAHNINWRADGNLTQTTCESGDNITPPTAPTKRGYHFTEWQASDNLFDITALRGLSKITIIDANTFSVSQYAYGTRPLSVLAPGLAVGDSVTIKANTTHAMARFVYNNGNFWSFGDTKIITQAMLDTAVTFYGDSNNPAIITNFQIIKNNQ